MAEDGEGHRANESFLTCIRAQARVLTPHRGVRSRWSSWACGSVCVNMGLAKWAVGAQGMVGGHGGQPTEAGGVGITKSPLSKAVLTVKGPRLLERKLPADSPEMSYGSHEEGLCREASCPDPQKAPPQRTLCLTLKCQIELLLKVWSPGNTSLVLGST